MPGKELIIKSLHENIVSSLWWEAFENFRELCNLCEDKEICHLVNFVLLPHIKDLPFISFFSLSIRAFITANLYEEGQKFIQHISSDSSLTLTPPQKLLLSIEDYRLTLFKTPSLINPELSILNFPDTKNTLSKTDKLSSSIILSHYYSFLIQYYKYKENTDLFLESIINYYEISKHLELNQKEKELLLYDACLVAIVSKNFFKYEELYYILNENKTEKLKSIFELFTKFIEGDLDYINKIINSKKIEILKKNEALVLFRTKIFRLFRIVREASDEKESQGVINADKVINDCRCDETEFVFVYTAAIENGLFEGDLDLESRSLKIFRAKAFVVKDESEVHNVIKKLGILKDRVKQMIKV